MIKEAMKMEPLSKHVVKIILSSRDKSPIFLLFDHRVIPFSEWALDYLVKQGYELLEQPEWEGPEIFDTRLID